MSTCHTMVTEGRKVLSDIITITLPLPPETLHPNGRTRSYQKRARLIKQARGDAALVAKQVGGICFPSATMQATFYMPRQRDGDGLNSWLKFYIDGIVADAGLVSNDSRLTLLPPKQITGKAAKGDRKVVLTLTKVS